MKEITEKRPYIQKGFITDKLFTLDSIFFDIETTGFSPNYAHIYMIGCAYRQEDSIIIHHLFAENADEEELILNKFIALLKAKTKLISFNGMGFDIPFIKAKCDLYNIEINFNSFDNIDIYKSVYSLKSILNLENYKQKTVEKFLELGRDDTYNGGDLINVYKEYTKSPCQEKFELLYLHNHEDVLGMLEILNILSYNSFFDKGYSISEISLNDYRKYDGTEGFELIISLANRWPLPKPVSLKKGKLYLNMQSQKSSLRIPIELGQLMYFYENYKDYYYLPAEDKAIHKSVAQYVDKDYREKCHAYNCYTRKNGRFLPIYGPSEQPIFKKSYESKSDYIEFKDEFMTIDAHLYSYVDELLQYIRKN